MRLASVSVPFAVLSMLAATIPLRATETVTLVRNVRCVECETAGPGGAGAATAEFATPR